MLFSAAAAAPLLLLLLLLLFLLLPPPPRLIVLQGASQCSPLHRPDLPAEVYDRVVVHEIDTAPATLRAKLLANQGAPVERLLALLQPTQAVLAIQKPVVKVSCWAGGGLVGGARPAPASAAQHPLERRRACGCSPLKRRRACGCAALVQQPLAPTNWRCPRGLTLHSEHHES